MAVLFGGVRVISGGRTPRGYQQITSIATATGLTVPVVANVIVGYAVIQCEGSSSVARWRDDGTAPTASVGMQLAAGQEMDYSGDLAAIQFIDGTGTSKLNVTYYS
jgi:hypothetical protein